MQCSPTMTGYHKFRDVPERRVTHHARYPWGFNHFPSVKCILRLWIIMSEPPYQTIHSHRTWPHQLGRHFPTDLSLKSEILLSHFWPILTENGLTTCCFWSVRLDLYRGFNVCTTIHSWKLLHCSSCWYMSIILENDSGFLGFFLEPTIESLHLKHSNGKI